MLRNLSILLLMVTFSVTVFAQENRKVDMKAPVIAKEPVEQHVANRIPGHFTPVGNFVAVDTMQNSYGPGISVLNPLAYDPHSDVLAVVYRGATTYAGGSGELWYSYSDNGGSSWTRVAPINSLIPIFARYPSMSISNSTQGTIAATTAGFSWPQLTPGAFGYIGYGVDQPIGGGATYAVEDQGPPAYSSQVPIWASDNSDWFFWASDNSVDASIRLWRTEDWATVEVIDPPQWASTVFNDGGNITMGGTSHNGVLYYGVLGTFTDPDPGNPIISGWYPGYSKSTDNGATWSDWNVCDFRQIPALSQFDRLFDWKKEDAFVSYNADINVDKDGYVHMIISVTDTIGSNNTGNNALVEIFETASGWDGKIIVEGLPDNLWTIWGGADNNPAIGQMGPNGYLAFNKERDVVFAQWVNSTSPADTIMDIYYSWRTLDGDWETPVNMSNTPNINEAGTHLAPLMKSEPNGDHTAYTMYWYEAGITGPVVNTLNRTVVYVGGTTFNVPSSIGDDNNTINSFELSQNYPNPFNPSTRIAYTLGERSNVVLKVYDVLGKEVATLVNESKEAGAHQVNFDASNLASGLYIYTINAGNFMSSKKMMLLK